MKRTKATVEEIEKIAGRMLESHEATDRAGAVVALSIASLLTSVRSSVYELLGKPGDPPPPFIQELLGRMGGFGPSGPPPPPEGFAGSPWLQELTLLRYGVLFVEETSLSNPGPPKPHLLAAFLSEDDAFAYVRARPGQQIKVLDLFDPDAEPYDPPETN